MNEKQKKNGIHYVNIRVFKYINDQPYEHKDLQGRKYIFRKNDHVYINDDETADFFSYKNQHFESLA